MNFASCSCVGDFVDVSHSETERQASVCGSPSCKTRVGCVHMYTVLELEVGCVFMYITFVAGRLLKVGRSLGMSVSNWVVVVVYFSAWDTIKRPSMWHDKQLGSWRCDIQLQINQSLRCVCTHTKA